MWKGLLILFGVGVAFAYFVFNFVGDVERSDPDSAVSKDERKAKAWAKYYTEDALGQQVLNFGNTPIKVAREVWSESPVRRGMLDEFPDFEGMRFFVNDRIKPSPFRDYLLKKIDDIESAYLGGEIDADKAKELLTKL
ncbi:hypothetical protein [Nitratifractor sp.]